MEWRIFIDYTDLNRACPKYSYSFLNIDKVEDNSTYYKLLLFMASYSNSNLILMFKADKDNTTLMTKWANYRYNIISFGMNKALETY